jgi:hypothetical protein
LVAIYDRALSQAEVSQNFEAGADNPVALTAASTPARRAFPRARRMAKMEKSTPTTSQPWQAR